MYSIDTNIVIGFLNEHDRLHDCSKSFLNSKGTQKLFLTQSVMVETKTLFLKKYNKALIEINSKLNKQTSIKLNDLSNKNLENFYKLIMSLIDKRKYDQSLFMELRNKGIEIISSLEFAIEKEFGELKTINLSNNQTKEQEEFLKKHEKIVFSDSNDKKIFIEVILISLTQELKEFFTNDKKFYNTSKKIISAEKYDIQFFKIIPNTKKPFFTII
jgi:predicted nucleic acid-binding protein